MPDRIEWSGARRFVEMGTTIQSGADIIVVKGNTVLLTDHVLCPHNV